MAEAKGSSVTLPTISGSAVKSLLYGAIVIIVYYFAYEYVPPETAANLTERYVNGNAFVYSGVEIIQTHLSALIKGHSRFGLFFIYYLPSRILYLVYAYLPLYLFVRFIFLQEAQRTLRTGEHQFNPRVFHTFVRIKGLPCLLFLFYCAFPAPSPLDSFVVILLSFIRGYFDYMIRINSPPLL